MTAGSVDASQRRAARAAGFLFLFCLILPTLNWAGVLSRLVVPDDAAATARNIMANESLFRVGMTIELMMAVGLVVLAAVLFTVLREVNGGLALVGLGLKLVEAGLVAAIVLVSFAALEAADGATHVAGFTPEQLQAPVGPILTAHTSLYTVPMVFLGTDLMPSCIAELQVGTWLLVRGLDSPSHDARPVESA